MRVLIVDNNRDAADTLAILLKFAHCEVRVAYDGFCAIDEATQFHPDLLLADLGMPRMDGAELARQIRQCKSLDRTVLAALTGYADAEHRELAAAAGFTEYFVKPVAAQDLYDLLMRVGDRITRSRAMVEESLHRANIANAISRRTIRQREDS